MDNIMEDHETSKEGHPRDTAQPASAGATAER
jgi:hypothetical protein